MESTTVESIAGLTLMSVNYEKAVASLKRRFGNPQLIVNKHFEELLSLPAVTSRHDLKGLRHLCDSVEARIRGLRALSIPVESYVGPLISILMKKYLKYDSSSVRSSRKRSGIWR